MATNLNGLSLDISGQALVHYNFLVSSSRNAAGNTVTYSVTCKCWLNTATSWIGTGGTLTFHCKINGVTASAVMKDSPTVWKGTSPHTTKVTLTVPSSSGGTLPASIWVSNSGYQYGSAVFSERSYVVTAPPLLDKPSSIVGSVDYNFSGPLVVHIKKNANYAYNYKLYVDVGGKRIIRTPRLFGDVTQAKVTFSSQELSEIYEQMKNTKKSSIVVSLSTMKGSTFISDAFAEGDIIIPDSPPTFTNKTVSVTAVNGISSLGSSFVENYSTLRVSFSPAQPKRGASIKKYVITVGTYSFETTKNTSKITVDCKPTSLRGKVNISVRAIDSRDTSSSPISTSVQVLSYTKPVIRSISAIRKNQDDKVTLTLTGKGASLGSKNTYKLSCSDGSSTYSLTPTVASNKETVSYSATLSKSFNTELSYTLTVTLTDLLGNKATAKVIVPPGKALLSFRKDRIGINRVPQQGRALDVGGTIYSNDKPIYPEVANANLLDNGGLTVWQRGTALAYSADDAKQAKIWADRWHALGDSPITSEKLEQGAKIKSGGPFDLYQVIEAPERFSGETVTATALLQCDVPIRFSICYGAAKKDSIVIEPASSLIQSSLTVSLPVGNQALSVHIASDSFSDANVLEIRWIKLECGANFTGFTPKHPAEELACCQRYYQVIEAESTTLSPIAFALPNNNIQTLILAAPVIPKRASPTILINGKIAEKGSEPDKDAATALSVQSCAATEFSSVENDFIGNPIHQTKIEISAEI